MNGKSHNRFTPTVRATWNGQSVADIVATAVLMVCALAFLILGAGLMSLTPGSSALSRAEYVAGLGAATLGGVLALWWVLSATLSLWLAVVYKRGAARSSEVPSTWLLVLSQRIAPSFMRRLATVVVGVSVVTASTVTTGFAATNPAANVTVSQAVSAPSPLFTTSGVPNTDPTPLWTPEAEQIPGSALIPDNSRTPVSEMVPGSHVVVDVGDTLWGLASRQLGGFASDEDISELWPTWYQANASTIGADPNRILPGQVLTIPEIPITH